jgi:hypothetical protein
MNSRKSAFMASVFVCLCLCGLLVSPATAAVYIGAGDVHTSTGGATVLNIINLASTSGGYIFNNMTTSQSVLAPGTQTVRSVGAVRLSEYNDKFGNSLPATYNNQQMTLVFAIEGTSTAVAPGSTVRLFEAQTGRIALFENPVFPTPSATGYNIANPMSWGAVTGDFGAGTLALAAPIAVWDLATPQTVIDMFPGPGSFNAPPPPLNEISVNTQDQTQAFGVFLGEESKTYAGPTKSGNDFWTTTEIPGLWPPDINNEFGVMKLEERLVVAPNVTFVNNTNSNGFQALNVIAQQLGGLPFFATAWGNATATDFAPFNGGAWGTNTPDNIFLGSTQFGFGAQPIPEPGSVAIFALILGGAGVIAGWRRRRARVGS